MKILLLFCTLITPGASTWLYNRTTEQLNRINRRLDYVCPPEPSGNWIYKLP